LKEVEVTDEVKKLAEVSRFIFRHNKESLIAHLGHQEMAKRECFEDFKIRQGSQANLSDFPKSGCASWKRSFFEL
jgi:hypothetical protein